MIKLGTIEVEPHPIPDRWVIGTLHEYGSLDVVATRCRSGEYIVTLGKNIMDGKTGEFKRAEIEQTPCIYPTLYVAFEAFAKFYL